MRQKEFKMAIKRSHERSEAYGVNWNQYYSNKILTGHELEQRLAMNQELIMVAKPYIDGLFEFVKGTNFFVILTDVQGCILYMVGDEDNLGRAHQLKMVPGAFMSEEHIGTNAMGTALAEEMFLQVTGADHFIEAYHRWTCSGAVIRNPQGRVIGSLDMTGDVESVHAHTLGMVVSAAGAIEKHLLVNRQNETLKDKSRFIQTTLDAMQEGVVSVDISGNILSVNQAVRRMLGYSEKELTGMNMSDLIQSFDEIRDVCLRSQHLEEEELQITAKSNRLFFTVSAFPVLSDEGEITACVFTFRDVRSVRKMANRIVGRRAIYTFDKIVGQSKALHEAIDFAQKVAESKSTVLLTGESGTGKEIFAHAIQNASQRRDENFVIVNCASIPRNLIESELFGYAEGAFTGAKRSGHPGKFEIADGGTIFLDEVGEMRLDMQARLLRVIQEGVVTRVGSNEPISVDVRIIAATNKNLKEEVARGNFRLDLYYRLNVLPVKLPALRERSEDIPLLVEYFMTRIGHRLNKKPVDIDELSLQRMMRYDWPGNVRELENFVELILNTEKVPVDLIVNQFRKEPLTAGMSRLASLEEVESQHIREVLRIQRGNISQVAKILGIGRNTLYRKMEKYGIDCSEIDQCSENEHHNRSIMEQ